MTKLTVTQHQDRIRDQVKAVKKASLLLDKMVVTALRDGLSYGECAEPLGVSRQYVHQLYADEV